MSCGWIMFVTHVLNSQFCLEAAVRNSTHFPQTIPSAGSEARSLPRSLKKMCSSHRKAVLHSISFWLSLQVDL